MDKKQEQLRKTADRADGICTLVDLVALVTPLATGFISGLSNGTISGETALYVSVGGAGSLGAICGGVRGHYNVEDPFAMQDTLERHTVGTGEGAFEGYVTRALNALPLVGIGYGLGSLVSYFMNR